MKINMRFIGILLLIMFITGCDSNTEEHISEDKKSQEVQKEIGSQDRETASSEEKTTENNEYPMPILPNWEELEIIFETIGNGSIDVWHGEFSFTGEIDEHFESYLVALTDFGFEVNVTQDDGGMKSLEIKKVIDGDEHIGNVLFNDNWVKSSLQHFK